MTTFLNALLTEPDQGLSVLESRILKTLLYFDLFRHPLSRKEIAHTLPADDCTETDLVSALDNLIQKKIVFSCQGYYSLQDAGPMVTRRLEGEQSAKRALPTAKKFSALIASFPFVRGICLSGSISKGYMDDTTDIDYFIITSPGRLWLCRSLLTAFKKIFLLNSRKNFCINYFIDTNSFLIPDQNIFTATELAYLVPTYNFKLFTQIHESNSWMREHYPQPAFHDSAYCIQKTGFTLKKMLEYLLSGWLGEKLDTFCMNITLRYWRNKFRHLDAQRFELRLRSRKNVSKHHPNGFQEKILRAYAERIENFERKHFLSLS